MQLGDKVRAQVYPMIKGVEVVGKLVEIGATKQLIGVELRGTVYSCYFEGARVTIADEGNYYPDKPVVLPY